MSYTKEQLKEKMTSKMREIIEAYEAFGAPPIASVSPRVARELPTLTDAVLAVMSRHLSKKLKGPVLPVGRVEHKVIPGGQGELLLRIYSPEGAGPFPTLVYYHGGGWVVANLDTYDASCRQLTDAANVVVVSVGYRQAPENKYPTPLYDAFTAYKWVLENAHCLNGDPHKVFVGGESAGGNLAAAVCMMARDRGVPLPAHQLLIYPVTNLSLDSESHRLYRYATPLNHEAMIWFREHYLGSAVEVSDPLVSPLKGNLQGLPSATIINAEMDPLCHDGEEYAEKLRQAGVDVKQKTYHGVTHEFFGMAALLPEAREALQFAADRILEVLDMQPETPPMDYVDISDSEVVKDAELRRML